MENDHNKSRNWSYKIEEVIEQKVDRDGND